MVTKNGFPRAHSNQGKSLRKNGELHTLPLARALELASEPVLTSISMPPFEKWLCKPDPCEEVLNLSMRPFYRVQRTGNRLAQFYKMTWLEEGLLVLIDPFHGAATLSLTHVSTIFSAQHPRPKTSCKIEWSDLARRMPNDVSILPCVSELPLIFPCLYNAFGLKHIQISPFPTTLSFCPFAINAGILFQRTV